MCLHWQRRHLKILGSIIDVDSLRACSSASLFWGIGEAVGPRRLSTPQCSSASRCQVRGPARTCPGDETWQVARLGNDGLPGGQVGRPRRRKQNGSNGSCGTSGRFLWMPVLARNHLARPEIRTRVPISLMTLFIFFRFQGGLMRVPTTNQQREEDRRRGAFLCTSVCT